jgi:hypothetical protein
MAQIENAIKKAQPDPNIIVNQKEETKAYDGPAKPLRASLASGAPLAVK